ncbi:organomercurial lyase [Suttonella ornithocola]|uniref:Alkylmercury lyase n=1 Tax=Suttonella ornithocola TaxID=279832 RepID=A0A380MKW2_9GAMM|nr:organomercurial lyase [Suttonella ornithocola]SUO93289.1 alkylmercury lyase [Suttonella ornithocola]
MYNALITQISQWPPTVKHEIINTYQHFKRGYRPKISEYPITKYCDYYIRADEEEIVACFGCETYQPTEHQILWKTSSISLAQSSATSLQTFNQVYAWCIWDAFFITQLLAEPAYILTQDIIATMPVSIFFNGQKFSSIPLWFTFPLKNSNTKTSLRECFCCRTKGFISLENAEIFAYEKHCEVIDMAEMNKRTEQMVSALSL